MVDEKFGTFHNTNINKSSCAEEEANNNCCWSFLLLIYTNMIYEKGKLHSNNKEKDIDGEGPSAPVATINSSHHHHRHLEQIGLSPEKGTVTA